VQVVVASEFHGNDSTAPLKTDARAHTGMMIMRIYALYDRSRRILALFVGVALAALAIGCVRSTRWSSLLINDSDDSTVASGVW